MRSSGPGTPSSRAVAAGFARLGAPTASPRNERAFMPLIETDAVHGVFADTGNTELNSYYIQQIAGRAFTAAGGTNEWRDGIVNRFYGGSSPVPGTYANWAVTQFHYDWAVLYNDMILELLRAVATVVR